MDKIVIVSDIHCGSKYGIIPPKWQSEAALELAVWLYEQWDHFCDSVGKDYVLILNADLIEGKQFKSQCTGLVTAKLSEQVDMAIAACEKLVANASKVFRTTGTAYHESHEGPLQAFDYRYDVEILKDYRDRIALNLDLGNGAMLNVKHSPEYGAMMYPLGAAEKEVREAILAEAAHGMPKATHLVRSHKHSTLGPVVTKGKSITYTPCWKLSDGWAFEKHQYAWLPSIGGVIMERDPLGHYGWSTRVVEYKIEAPAVHVY